MTGHRLADAALRCYPAWWRRLYGEEVGQLTDDLLSDGRSELRLAANLLGGALAARLWARAMPPRAELWLARARASIAVATLPFLGVLPFVFFGLHANEGYRTLPQWQVLRLTQAPTAEVIRQIFTLLHVGVIVGLIAALAGWLSLIDGVKLSRVLEPSHPRRLLRLPVVFLVVLLGLYIARVTQLPRGVGGVPGSPGLLVVHGGNPGAAALLLDGIWAVLGVGSVAAIVAIARVAKVCEVPWKTMTSGRRVAATTSIVLCAMAVCAVVALAVSGPHGFVTRPMGIGVGNLHAPHTAYMVFPDWALMAVPLMLASAMSFAGWRASGRASAVLRTLDPRIGITHTRF